MDGGEREGRDKWMQEGTKMKAERLEMSERRGEQTKIYIATRSEGSGMSERWVGERECGCE